MNKVYFWVTNADLTKAQSLPQDPTMTPTYCDIESSSDIGFSSFFNTIEEAINERDFYISKCPDLGVYNTLIEGVLQSPTLAGCLTALINGNSHRPYVFKVERMITINTVSA